MLDLFQEFGISKTSEYFGTYRVELGLFNIVNVYIFMMSVTRLFGCVFDIHNFEIVLRVLSPFEAACVICRIGIVFILYKPCVINIHTIENI